MDWFVIGFFVKKIVKGFGIGLAIRMIIGIMFRTDMTFWGLIRSALVVDFFYMLMTIYILYTI